MFALFAQITGSHGDLTGLGQSISTTLLIKFLLRPYLGLLSHDPWAPCELASLWPLGACGFMIAPALTSVRSRIVLIEADEGKSSSIASSSVEEFLAFGWYLSHRRTFQISATLRRLGPSHMLLKLRPPPNMGVVHSTHSNQCKGFISRGFGFDCPVQQLSQRQKGDVRFRALLGTLPISLSLHVSFLL